MQFIRRLIELNENGLNEINHSKKKAMIDDKTLILRVI